MIDMGATYTFFFETLRSYPSLLILSLYFIVENRMATQVSQRLIIAPDGQTFDKAHYEQFSLS